MNKDYEVAIIREDDELSKRNYTMIIGLGVLLGFICYGVMLYLFNGLFSKENIIPIMIACGIVLVSSYFISDTSKDIVVKVMSYVILTMTIGILHAMAVNTSEFTICINTMYMTIGATIIMWILATIFPKMFDDSICKKMLIILTIMTIITILIILLKLEVPYIIDLCFAMVWMFNIGNNVVRAQKKQKTLSNAFQTIVRIYFEAMFLYGWIYTTYKVSS